MRRLGIHVPDFDERYAYSIVCEQTGEGLSCGELAPLLRYMAAHTADGAWTLYRVDLSALMPA